MVTYKINERSKMKENIRKEIMGMNLAELNELGAVSYTHLRAHET